MPSRHTAVADAAKPSIHAQRFRTKLCDKFATTGSCPYVHRCMFAHGEAELRTTAQNVADGLVNETSIRKYKRAQYEARKRAARSKPAAAVAAGVVVAPAATAVVARTSHPMPVVHPISPMGRVELGSSCDVPSAASLLANTPADGDEGVLSMYGAAEDAGALSDSDNTFHHLSRPPTLAVGSLGDSGAAAPRFRHDPYSLEKPERLCTPTKASSSSSLAQSAGSGTHHHLLPPALIGARSPHRHQHALASSSGFSSALASPAPSPNVCAT